MFARQCFKRVVIDFLGGIQAVAHHVEPFATHVHGRAVRQVAAIRQGHAKNGVAGFEQSKKYRLVCLRTRVGLNIGRGRTK